ncbi:AfsR/SARP family transcriptional regulator [Streptomyces sp. NPDC017991]|uniref:AfsR/SARP family transcriptional regulator n=1 Tax=Streptomyces sp. NPDC017991 TaxID=3365026 RepID=UPI0037BD880E
MLDVRLLGPAEVWFEDRRLSLGGPKPTALLAALVTHPGEVVSTERLVDLVWEEHPPVTAGALVASYVAALRRALASVGAARAIQTRSPGYLADFPVECVDARRFEAAVVLGRRSAAEGHTAEAADALRQALELWRGRDALEGLWQLFARTEASRLVELRLVAREEVYALDLVLNRADEVIPGLWAHVCAHPLRERARGQLMSALFRVGRVPDALRVYREGRELFRAELGIDPGPELRALHQALLRGDTAVLGLPRPASGTARLPRTGPPASAPATPAAQASAAPLPAGVPRAIGAPARVPSQLPPDVADFVGRAEQIAWVVAVLADSGAPGRTAPPVGVITGRSGTGKTALAVHAGHRTADRFPDGRLFLDLRAADAAPLETTAALARLLRAVGVDPEALPADAEDLLALYRTHLTGRRVLLILDNATGEAQLRPLLPPGPGSGVLVTSRRQLVALEGAVRLNLTALAEPEAMELLGRVAGPERTADEPDTVKEIVRLCGRLPLAVRIAGARLAARPHWAPARLAVRLRDERRRLDELRAGDLELRTGLELGYAELDPQEQRVLRRLALLELPDFAAWTAAPLLDLSVEDAEDAVERLVDCHLIELVGVDGVGQLRYRIHDLAREHARERCLAEETPQERGAAVERLVACWLALAREAAARAPGGASRLMCGPHAGQPMDAAVREALLARPADWFAAEQASLTAGVVYCAAHGRARAARDLAGVLIASSVALYNRFDAWSRSHTLALEAVRRCGQTEDEAWLLNGLGQLRYEEDQFDDSYTYFADALRLFERIGPEPAGADVARGRAAALAGMGSARREQARYAEALERLEPALAAYEHLGDPVACAHIRYGIGYVHREQGRHEEAWRELTRALELYRKAADRHGEALTLRSLGLCHRALGRLAEAEDFFTQALNHFEADDDVFGAMYTGQSLAKVYIRQGRLAEARERLAGCLAITRERQDTFGEALVLRTLGECGLADRDPDAAEEALHSALGLWERLDLPLWRARTLRDMATVARIRGDDASAEAARADAQEVFRRLGSREATEDGRPGEGPPATT